MRRILILTTVVALAATACGGGDDATSAGGGEVRTVLADYRHDEFASAFLSYFPNTVQVRPGDTVRFKQAWTGEPHSVTMGTLVDEMFELLPLVEKYESAEEALAAGESPELIDKVLFTLDRVPPMTNFGFEVYQPGAQPCYVERREDVPAFKNSVTEEVNPAAACPPGGRRKPAFTGRQALYNSGFIPYDGPGGNVFEVPVAEDAMPGTYQYFCNYHFIFMSGSIEVVEPDAEIPSQDVVSRQARRQIDAYAEKALPRVRGVKARQSGGKVGDLELPLAGRDTGEDIPLIINEFLPNDAVARVGQKVTWTFDGATHTVSFNVPKYFPIFTVEKDGTVVWNPDAYEPVRVEIPDRAGTSPHPDGEAPPVEVDGGRWDGRGGYLSSGALYPGDRFSLTFTKPGTYPYACVLHPQMVGTLTVKG